MRQKILSFKSFLIEARSSLDTIKKIYKDKIDVSHDSLGQHKESDNIIDHFANNADPSKDKKYTHWIVSKYNKGQFRQEDHARIHDALNNFENHKNKLQNKDINQYKHISDVEDAVDSQTKTKSNKEVKKEIKHEGADLIHSEDGMTVHRLKTKEGACSYGAGTRWCTAAKRDNMFDQYNKKGPLYVVHTPDKRKYQFHFQSSQFMNEKDQPERLENLVNKYPSLKNVKEFKDSSHGIEFAKDEKERNHLISKALDNKNEEVRYQAIQHPKVTSEHITKALDDKDNDVRRQAIRHPNATSEHITKALYDKDNDVRYHAIQHPNATSEHVSKALNDDSHLVRRQAIRHPNATSEHVSKALDDKNEEVRYHAIQHPKITSEHISKALDNKNEEVRYQAIRHPNATSEHITKALDDKDNLVRYQAIQHPNATSEHISKALYDKDNEVRRHAIQHPNATSEHITKALDDKDNHVREIAKQRKGKLGNLKESSEYKIRDYIKNAIVDKSSAENAIRFGDQEDREYFINKNKKRTKGIEIAHKILQRRKRKKF